MKKLKKKKEEKTVRVNDMNEEFLDICRD